MAGSLRNMFFVSYRKSKMGATTEQKCYNITPWENYMNIHGMLPDKVFIFCVDHKSKLAAASGHCLIYDHMEIYNSLKLQTS